MPASTGKHPGPRQRRRPGSPEDPGPADRPDGNRDPAGDRLDGRDRCARPTGTGARRRSASLIHFSIGDDRMPKEVYHAYGYVKKAAAIVNGRAGPAARNGRPTSSHESPTR